MLLKSKEKQNFSFLKKNVPYADSITKNIFHRIGKRFLFLSTLLGATILASCLIGISGLTIWIIYNIYKTDNHPVVSNSQNLVMEEKLHLNRSLYDSQHLDKETFIKYFDKGNVHVTTVTDSTVQLTIHYKNSHPQNFSPFLNGDYPFDLSNYTAEFKNNQLYKIYSSYPNDIEKNAWKELPHISTQLKDDGKQIVITFKQE